MTRYLTLKHWRALSGVGLALLMTMATPLGVAQAQPLSPITEQSRTAQILRAAAEQKRAMNALQVDVTSISETWSGEGNGGGETPGVVREKSQVCCAGQRMRWAVESRNVARGDTPAVVPEPGQTASDAALSPLNFGHQVEGKWLFDLLRASRVRWQGTVHHFKYGQLQVARCETDDVTITVWLSPKLNGLIVCAEKQTGDVRTVYQATNVKEFAPGVWFAASGLCCRQQGPPENRVIDQRRTFRFRHLRLSRRVLGQVENACKPGEMLFDGSENKTLLRTASGWQELPRQTPPLGLDNRLVAAGWLSGVALGVCGPGVWYRRRSARLAR